MKIIEIFKSLLSFLFSKDTLIKIILLQIIFFLLVITLDGIKVRHRGTVELKSNYGGFEIKKS
jgi:hypothetical protein